MGELSSKQNTKVSCKWVPTKKLYNTVVSKMLKNSVYLKAKGPKQGPPTTNKICRGFGFFKRG